MSALSEKRETPRIRVFLFLLLLGIWGTIGYRIYHKYFNRKTWKPAGAAGAAAEKNSGEDEPYRLLLNYPNPFDQGLSAVPKPTEDSALLAAASVAPPPEAAVVPVQFPEIEYKGFVHLKNGRTVALVVLNNRSIHWAAGEKIEDVLLQDIAEDSIRIRFQGQRRTYPKLRQ